MKLHECSCSQYSIIKTGHVFVLDNLQKMSVCVRSCSVISGIVRVSVLFAIMFVFGMVHTIYRPYRMAYFTQCEQRKVFVYPCL